MPAILQAVEEPAPSGEMFADGIRVEGLRVLAQNRVAEGIRACVQYARDQNPWDSQKRTPELMKILLTYGAHAKSVIPQLTRIADYFEKEEKDFPKNLMLVKARSVRETIAAIEASTDASTDAFDCSSVCCECDYGILPPEVAAACCGADAAPAL